MTVPAFSGLSFERNFSHISASGIRPRCHIVYARRCWGRWGRWGRRDATGVDVVSEVGDVEVVVETDVAVVVAVVVLQAVPSVAAEFVACIRGAGAGALGDCTALVYSVGSSVTRESRAMPMRVSYTINAQCASFAASVDETQSVHHPFQQ